MLDDSKVHTENGLVQKSTMIGGFRITVSISTGVCGESSCLIIHDGNLYPDDDSRSDRPSEYIIPINYVDDLQNLRKIIKKSINKRNKTLIQQ